LYARRWIGDHQAARFLAWAGDSIVTTLITTIPVRNGGRGTSPCRTHSIFAPIISSIF